MINSRSTRRRLGGMETVGCLLARRSVLSSRLGTLRRLYRLVVGPRIASESAVVFYRDGAMTIGVRSRTQIRGLEELEPFLLRTLRERAPQAPVREVRYAIRPDVGGTALGAPSPARIAPRVTEASRRRIEQTAAHLANDRLREGLARWMTLVAAREETA